MSDNLIYRNTLQERLFIEFTEQREFRRLLHNSSLIESGRLEFDEFITLAAKFIVEEDAEALEKELREAFRLYDKEGRACERFVEEKKRLFDRLMQYGILLANIQLTITRCLNNRDYFHPN